MSRKTDLQTLKYHVLNGISDDQLSEHLKQKLERLRYCRTLYNNYKITERYLHYKTKYPESKATMYRDFKDCEELFGELDMKEINFHRNLLIEYNFNLAKKCSEAKDFATEQKVLKELRLLIGVKSDTPLAALYEALQQHQVLVKLPKEQLNILDRIVNAGGVIDMNSIGTEDIDFEDITDDKTTDNNSASLGPVSSAEE